MLQHLGIPREYLLLRQCVKENSRYYRRFSLRENAYLVLKPVEIYGSLSSYGRVDRAEKRCWHIDAPHAALEGRRCKAAEIGKHAAADIDKHRRPCGL